MGRLIVVSMVALALACTGCLRWSSGPPARIGLAPSMVVEPPTVPGECKDPRGCEDANTPPGNNVQQHGGLQLKSLIVILAALGLLIGFVWYMADRQERMDMQP